MAEVHEGIVGAHQAWVKMKWVEAIPIPFNNVNNEKVIKIRKDNLIHRFGIPKIIIADQGRVFTGDQVKEFANIYCFCWNDSLNTFAQANGQAESSKKIRWTSLEKMIKDNPSKDLAWSVVRGSLGM